MKVLSDQCLFIFAKISYFFRSENSIIYTIYEHILYIITPPYPFEKAEYVSQIEFGKPFLALFTSLRLSSLYESNSLKWIWWSYYSRGNRK